MAKYEGTRRDHWAGILFFISVVLVGCVSVVVVTQSEDTETEQDQEAQIDSERKLDIEENE